MIPQSSKWLIGTAYALLQTFGYFYQNMIRLAPYAMVSILSRLNHT